MVGTNQADKRYQVLEIDRTAGQVQPGDPEPATAGLNVLHYPKIYSSAEIDDLSKSWDAQRVVPLFYGIAGRPNLPLATRHSPLGRGGRNSVTDQPELFSQVSSALLQSTTLF